MQCLLAVSAPKGNLAKGGYSGRQGDARNEMVVKDILLSFLLTWIKYFSFVVHALVVQSLVVESVFNWRESAANPLLGRDGV